MHLSPRSLFLLTLLLTPTSAQITSSFTDPITNITFQRFFGAKTSFAFGIALPLNPSTDFIGQISCPCPSNTCWGGISLADDMVGPLLLAAWPNGNTVQSSFRLAKTEDSSPPVAKGNFSAVTIEKGTSVNGTHMLFTFLCQGCVEGKLGFAASDTNEGIFEMGWALADTGVSNVADPAAELTFHNKGFDSFDAQLSLARSASFGEWAALAGVRSNGLSTPVPTAVPGTGSKFGDDDSDDDEDEEEGEDDD